MGSASNFAFLGVYDKRLVTLGGLAERYFRDDPSTAIVKLRQFAELTAKIIAARHGAYRDERETFDDTLRRLSYDRIIPREVADIFHTLRKTGNAAVHEAKGGHAEALTALKFARSLGVWFHRTYGRQPNFNPGAFIPPPEPVDATASLRQEIEKLRQKVAETEDAAAVARREAEDHARARETVEERLRREAEERAAWEQLAHESEAEKSAIVAKLATMQAEAEAAPRAEVLELVERGEEAAAKLDLDEAETRALIDQQLRDNGWEADTKTLRHSSGVRPAKGRNMAIAEWPTANGPADYALFVGTMLVGVVEAKRKRKNISAAIDQSERYSVGIKDSADFSFAGGLWGEHRVPFVFAANGRSYLKQIETESGIWFRDTRRAANHRRALVNWPTPEGLSGLLEVDQDAADAALKAQPFEFGFPLRHYQEAAIRAVEMALSADQRSLLVAMATGTGKTKLAIALLYRLLSAKRFRRICFVVDRSALGHQTEGEFSTTKVVSGKTFAEIFGLKGLGDVSPDMETKVHICTIQGLVKRVLYAADTSEVPPVDQYDLIVIDECHRGYLLDREMSDAELSFRGQDDYISKYRRVLEYFDAVKIGLTATPALHTTDIFGEPIFRYSYREAVIDGYLIDHEPPIRIETALARAGITFEKDEQLELLDTRSGEIDTATLPDELHFEVEKFNRQVITPEFNRVVAEELAKHIDPELGGKTLIFAATDAHADIVVSAIKNAFADAYGEIDDAAVRKITGSVDKVQTLIRSFRNDANPKIAVTVDLLTTGIDVPKITNLVFLRRVNSRILYEQMIGRATRKCDEIGKEVFRIFDAVDLYPHLQNLTDMKPVVVNPSISFEQLVGEMVNADDDAQRETIREQIAVKLRRRLKKLPEEARQRFEAVAGETPEAMLQRLLSGNAHDLAAWLGDRAAIGPILDWQSDGDNPRYVPISHHADEVVAVTRGYGDAQKPEDFLDSFSAFVRDNINAIAALKLVVQRPRDLTRADLKELRLALDRNGCLLPLALGSTGALAADFAAQDRANCAMAMAGEIQAGDSAKFERIAASLGLLKAKPGDYIYNEIDRAVCLDSLGGSWVEGRIIAGMVSDFGITTRVLDGGECLSACSLIFMAGRVRGEEFDGPSRYLHVLGRLGFHGPYLVPSDDRSYSASEMRAVSVTQNLVIADFIKFGSRGYAYSNSGAVSMSLVGEMLARGPEEMIYADTVERIARWNIALEGTKDHIRLDKTRLFQACENALNLPFDRPASTITPERYQYEPDVEIRKLRSSDGDIKVFARVQFSGDANRICDIELKKNDDGTASTEVEGIHICTDNGNTGISTGDCPEYSQYFPFYYALSPGTATFLLSK